jgi:hypothetical protein
LAAVTALYLSSLSATAIALPPSTWVALAPLPSGGGAPVFAIAVDPTNDLTVIAGGGKGGIYRSADGGSTWKSVQKTSAGVLAIDYSPFNASMILAGTNGAGAFVSTDGGSRWTPATGLEQRSVRAFGYARILIAAATDRGVYTSADGISWVASGLSTTSIDAIAVAAVNPPVRLVAGGDAGAAAGIPLFESLDGGSTWTQLAPAISGTIITSLAAGPLPPTSGTRPLLIGTNSGLFTSADNGSSASPLSGAQLLPSTDYTQLSFTATHFDRFYVASDGGGGQSGGLWSSYDAGLHFSSLQPPLPSVTALAVSRDEMPILYVATFRASDHTASLWAYHDTGGTPNGPVNFTPAATPARVNGSSASWLDNLRGLLNSQVPYIAIGVLAVLVIGLAVVSHFRSRRR